jgi:hypothetical protein
LSKEDKSEFQVVGESVDVWPKILEIKGDLHYSICRIEEDNSMHLTQLDDSLNDNDIVLIYEEWKEIYEWWTRERKK